MICSKNNDLLVSFTEYCENHPGERFWQALRNWCGAHFVFVAAAHDAKELGCPELVDTFSSNKRNPLDRKPVQ